MLSDSTTNRALTLEAYLSDFNFGFADVAATGYYFAHISPDSKDSIPLHLVQKVPYYPPMLFTPPLFYFDVSQSYSFDWGIDLLLWLATPSCGDTYHDNGKLHTHVECIDGVKQGKSIYYDQSGHKKTEDTYSNDKRIKHKSYDDRSRILVLHHYDLKGHCHGICITWDYEESTKTVAHYSHNKQHGSKEIYKNGVLETRQFYSNDVLLKDYQYHEDGSVRASFFYSNGNPKEQKFISPYGLITHHSKYLENGDPEFFREWNTKGVLLLEKIYQSGKPVGIWYEWLDYRDSTRNAKRLQYYENGLIVKQELVVNEIINNTIHYKNGIADWQIAFFETGDSAFYKVFNDNGETGYEKRWIQNSDLSTKVVHEFHTKTDPVLGRIFIGKGFYSYPHKDTLFLFEIEDDPWHVIQKRWVLYKGDTVRMDYCKNNGLTSYETEVYVRNHYQYDSKNRKYVPHGLWKIYDNNNLTAVHTFNLGVLDMRTIYYSNSDDSVFVTSIQNYDKGKKSGRWVLYSGKTIYKTDYRNDLKNGFYQICDSIGYPLIVARYKNDTLNGSYAEYSIQNKSEIKISGQFLNGEKSGEWVYYDNRMIKMKGEFENDRPVGKWYENYFTKRGKQKLRKIKRPDPDQIPVLQIDNQPTSLTIL